MGKVKISVSLGVGNSGVGSGDRLGLRVCFFLVFIHSFN
jgi:hypothetical protein